MENRAHALAAGLFELIFGTALIAAGMWFGKEEIKQNFYVIVTKQSVAGVKVEAPVRYHGVEVGRVESIRIEPGLTGQIRIRIGVQADTPMTRGTYAQLGYQGVTGLAYVSLNDSGASGEPLQGERGAGPEAQIPLRASLLDSGEDLMGTSSEIADRLKELLGNDNQKAVKKTLAGLETLVGDDNQKLLRRTLAGIDEVARRTAALAGRLEPGERDLPALMADARSTAQKADQQLSSLNALSLKLEQRIDVVDRTLAGASGAVDEVGAAARAVNEETLPRLNALVDQLNRETRALDRLINTLGQHPQSVVFGAPPGSPGPGEPGFSSGGAR
ncbi:MAG: MCE family protein [Betaproteobacteria bacterium]|nr:MCE family protein [Betaproteobacteria bacterium]